MRIAFCGASGTGKTTLARYVSEKWGLPMEEHNHPEFGKISTTRLVAAELTGKPDPYLVDKMGLRAEFQRLLQKRKYEWEEKHRASGFVTDRTHYDNMAYSILHDIEDTGSDDDFWKNTYEYSGVYDYVFFTPILGWHDPGRDPARKASSCYQRVYEDVLESVVIPRELVVTIDRSEQGSRRVLVDNVIRIGGYR